MAGTDGAECRCAACRLRRPRAAVDGGLHWRTSWAGGSQSMTGVTANEMRSDGLELDNTALSRDFPKG
jgi:hypothetical protein